VKNDASELLAKALQLPAEARAALAGSLIESLDETIDEDISHAAISFLCGISPKSNGPMKLLPWPTAEGNLATGRTASRAEERATWPANQRLERTAEKRGRSAAGRWAASVGPLKRNHIRAAFSVSRSKRDRLLLRAHIPVQLRLDRLFARTSCLQKEDVCSSHSLFRAFYSKRRES